MIWNLWNSMKFSQCSKCIECSSMFMSHVYYTPLKFSLWFSLGARIKHTVWSAAHWNCMRRAIRRRCIGAVRSRTLDILTHNTGHKWLLAVPDTWHHQHHNVRYKYMIGAKVLVLLSLVSCWMLCWHWWEVRFCLTLRELLWMLTNKLSVAADL